VSYILISKKGTCREVPGPSLPFGWLWPPRRCLCS